MSNKIKLMILDQISEEESNKIINIHKNVKYHLVCDEEGNEYFCVKYNTLKSEKDIDKTM